MSKPTENSAEITGRTALTSRSATRRAALMGGAAAAGAAVLLPGSASATTARPQSAVDRAAGRRQNQEARGEFAVPIRHDLDVPDPWIRHVLSRFSGGPSEQRLIEVGEAGGIDAWFLKQLTPNDVPDPEGDALWSWFPTLALSPQERFDLSRGGPDGPVPGWMQMQDLANYVMLRRLISARSVQDSMVDFWSNQIHVASPSTDCWVWRVDYEETIRRLAMGRFADLLFAAVTHPAMTLYRSNDQSTMAAINEDLGRELLECHTVGVDSGYTQKDVLNSSRLLTGYTIDKKVTWEQTFDPARHWIGRVKVLGFSNPNSAPDGRPVIAKYLNYLAHHNATATRIATRLAVRFVSDNPSQTLISTLKTAYLDADTAIGPVLQALVASNEFKNSAMQKVRTPVEDAVATWGTLGVKVDKPVNASDAANQFLNFSKGIGQVAYDWPSPEGFPDELPDWTDSGRMLGSMRAHWLAAIGHPTDGITYKTPMQWVPQLPTTFDNVVDYVARVVLRMECTPTMLQAACVATDCSATTMIDATHGLIRFKFPRLIVSLLDTPEHLSR
jgi:uncharacterized protein DUF1800